MLTTTSDVVAGPGLIKVLRTPKDSINQQAPVQNVSTKESNIRSSRSSEAKQDKPCGGPSPVPKRLQQNREVSKTQPEKTGSPWRESSLALMLTHSVRLNML